MIVVTGGTGTMATALRAFLPADTKYLSHNEWDVTGDPPRMDGVECVIHAAALTDHQHPNAAEVIETNIIGTQRVARYCRSQDIRMVYLSTHYVYPGETGNYREIDPVRPIGTYAWSKYAGEGWVSVVPNHLIIRGSWYSPEKLLKMSHGALTDAYHNRETPAAAAEKIATLVARGATGVFNIGGKRMSFYELLFVQGIMAKRITRAHLNPKSPYPFPADSSVNTEKYAAYIR